MFFLAASKKILLNYERSRKSSNLMMTALIELFKQGFENQNPWINLGRNMAFRITKENNCLRKQFIKRAAGII